MKWTVVVMLLLWLNTGGVRAMQPPEQLELLWEQAQLYGISEENSLEQGTSSLLQTAKGELERILYAGIGTAVKLLGVSLLCSVVQKMEVSQDKRKISASQVAGVAAITALSLSDVSAMIGLGRETIGRMEVFSRTLLPAMAVVSALTGHLNGAAVRQSITVLFSEFLVLAMDRLLIPMVYCYVAVSCAQAVVGNGGLSRLSGMIKWGITSFLTGMMLIFVGYLTASGVIAGSVDAAKIKAAKMAISRAVPVVGGILADASETVLAGAGILKGTVGVVGLLVVLAICITPFLHLAVQYLIYKGVCALTAVMADSQICALIDAIGSAFGLVLGMTGAAALILLVSLVSTVSVVAA